MVHGPSHYESLISRQLDGDLSEAEFLELQAWLNADAENALRFSNLAKLHERLDFHFRTGVESASPSNPSPAVFGNLKHWAAFSMAATAASVILVGVVLLLQGFTEKPVQATGKKLRDIIQANKERGPRTFKVEPFGSSRKRFNEKRKTNKKPEPSLDNAILHLRGDDQYVLIRNLADGSQFITGSDGNCSWSVPPRGRVRISQDPHRFQGKLPGSQQGIPFIDMTSNLKVLSDDYEIRWIPSEQNIPQGLGKLVAEKKSRSYRGPKYVEISCQPDTNEIVEIIMEGLPQAQGGPKSITMKLIAEKEFAPNFFDHTYHHRGNRKIISDYE